MNLLLQHFVAIKTGTNAGNVDNNWQQPDLLPSSSATTLLLTCPIEACVEHAGSAAVRAMWTTEPALSLFVPPVHLHHLLNLRQRQDSMVESWNR
mmetsp:Transcript_24016/g.36035  ORF Transcript_24016/g.36035 Transcript_24016/m.36035 type:complete len:95 (-) Transcript_24016:352-636(-)